MPTVGSILFLNGFFIRVTPIYNIYNFYYRKRSQNPNWGLRRTWRRKQLKRQFSLPLQATPFLPWGPKSSLTGQKKTTSARFLGNTITWLRLWRGRPSNLSFLRGWGTPLNYNIRARVEVFRFAIFLKCLFQHFNRFPPFLKTLHFHFDNSFIF